jgi:hypothetical protein
MPFITGRTAINALNSGTVADAVLSFSHGASVWRIKFRLPQSKEPTTQGCGQGIKMESEKKALYDAFADLRDFWHARWISRREFAWKITVGAWALLAAATVYVKHRPSTLTLMIVLITYVLLLTFGWIRVIQKRDFRDSRMSFHFNSLAEQVLIPNTPIEPKPTKATLRDFIEDGIAMAQVLGSVFIATAAFYLVGR